MNKSIIVTIIGVLLVASFFVGYSIKETDSDSSEIEILQEQIKNLQNQNAQLQQQINVQKNTTTQNIPTSVLAKYDELEQQYKKSLGAGISLCIKDNEKIYAVWGSGGFTGVTFYYTVDGNEIGSFYFTDAIDVNNPPPEPPVDIREYNCTGIKESEQFVNE